MNYRVDTAVQLRAVIKALRQGRKVSQADLGRLLGVNQKRIAKIETDPGVTSWNQIARLVSALGGRIVIQEAEAGSTEDSTPPASDRPVKRTRQSKTPATW